MDDRAPEIELAGNQEGYPDQICGCVDRWWGRSRLGCAKR